MTTLQTFDKPRSEVDLVSLFDKASRYQDKTAQKAFTYIVKMFHEGLGLHPAEGKPLTLGAVIDLDRWNHKMRDRLRDGLVNLFVSFSRTTATAPGATVHSPFVHAGKDTEYDEYLLEFTLYPKYDGRVWNGIKFHLYGKDAIVVSPYGKKVTEGEFDSLLHESLEMAASELKESTVYRDRLSA